MDRHEMSRRYLYLAQGGRRNNLVHPSLILLVAWRMQNLTQDLRNMPIWKKMGSSMADILPGGCSPSPTLQISPISSQLQVKKRSKYNAFIA